MNDWIAISSRADRIPCVFVQRKEELGRVCEDVISVVCVGPLESGEIGTRLEPSAALCDHKESE